jgi:hypothetical protein
MFKLPDQEWLEKQPKHTQEWLKKQPLWHTADLFRFFAMGIFVGFLIGLVI